MSTAEAGKSAPPHLIRALKTVYGNHYYCVMCISAQLMPSYFIDTKIRPSIAHKIAHSIPHTWKRYRFEWNVCVSVANGRNKRKAIGLISNEMQANFRWTEIRKSHRTILRIQFNSIVQHKKIPWFENNWHIHLKESREMTTKKWKMNGRSKNLMTIFNMVVMAKNNLCN